MRCNRSITPRRLTAAIAPAARPLAALAALLLAASAGTAAADAPQDRTCRGAALQGQAVVRGPVLHIPDGRTLCVAQGFNPDTWVPLRLADAPPHTTRATLLAAAFGKDVACVVDPTGAATCQTQGRSVADLAKAESSVRAGQAWREAGAPRLQGGR